MPSSSPSSVSARRRRPRRRRASGHLSRCKPRTSAHKGDFDYLLGDWEFSAVSREYGNFRGYWSAVRLDGGQILDEYRIVGDKGETFYVTSTLRNYNKVLDRWELVGMDAGNGLQDVGTATPRRRRDAHRTAVRCDERSAVDVEDSVLRHPARSILVDRRPLDRRRQDVAGEASDDRRSPNRTAPLARPARAGEEQRGHSALGCA